MSESLEHRLAAAEATIAALLAGQIDAVVDPATQAPVMLTTALEALRASEARYRGIVETSNEGIWTMDLDGLTTFVNQRLADLMGMTCEAMIGRPVSSFVVPSDYEQSLARQARTRRGISEDHDITLRRADGDDIRVLLKTSPIRDHNGGITGALAMITDRTRYWLDRSALRRSEDQYRQIVETTTDGIVKTDRDAAIVFANGRFAQLVGRPVHELVGHSHYDLVTAAARPAAIEAFEHGGSPHLETIYRREDGTEVAVEVATSHVVDTEGRTSGALHVVRDVTERKQLQSQLMVSDRMASVGTLAAGVAHEINNPLAAVIANLDYIAGIQSAPGLAEIAAPLQDAREAAQRVRSIVRDLRIFARAPLEAQDSVDVHEVIETSLRMALPETRHRARIERRFGVVPRVAANAGRLGQVFLNLIVNAAQALPEGNADSREIAITTRVAGDRVIAQVTDTGTGIPANVIGRIFDAFFTTKEVGVGTGLGLAISHRIIADLGGRLTVDSTVGKGTTFQIDLPIARDQSIPRRSSPVIAPSEGGRHGKVLVVDDELAVGRAVQRILGTDHEVVVVVAAEAALGLCTAGAVFDVIVCDLMMPTMSGMALHAELQRALPAQAARMIFLTGGAVTPAARAFLADTAIEHVEKPFDSAALRARVRRYVYD